MYYSLYLCHRKIGWPCTLLAINVKLHHLYTMPCTCLCLPLELQPPSTLLLDNMFQPCT